MKLTTGNKTVHFGSILTPSKAQISELELQRSAHSFAAVGRDIREATPDLDSAKAPGVNIFIKDDFGGMETGGRGVTEGGSLFYDLGYGEDTVDIHDDLQLGAAANNSGQYEQHESFALESLKASAFERQQKHRSRKRHLIIDDPKNIGVDEMR
ncbi:unnamed protein product, partial [Strongylus vulgaris]